MTGTCTPAKVLFIIITCVVNSQFYEMLVFIDVLSPIELFIDFLSAIKL